MNIYIPVCVLNDIKLLYQYVLADTEQTNCSNDATYMSHIQI